jgi:hypothetical protein
VFGSFLALLFDDFEVCILLFNGGLQDGGAAHVVLGFGWLELAGDAQVVEAGLACVLGGDALADFSVELAPGGVDEADGLINGFKLVVDLTVQIEVFPAIFEKVLLIPSAELGTGDLRRVVLPIGAADGRLVTVGAELADFAHLELPVLAAADESAAFGQEHVGMTPDHEGNPVGGELVFRLIPAGMFVINGTRVHGLTFLPLF